MAGVWVGFWGILTHTLKWKNAICLFRSDGIVLFTLGLLIAAKLAQKEVWNMAMCLYV